MRSNLHALEPEELMAYLDGELPLPRAADAAAHLEECRQCQILAAEMKSVSQGLAAWEVPSTEEPLNEVLANALAVHEEQSARTRRWGWFASGGLRRALPWAGGSLAGGLAVFLLTFALISSFSRGEHEPAPVASRNQTLALSATADQAGKTDQSFPKYSAPMTDSQRLEVLKRQQMAQVASNLDVNQAPTAQGQMQVEPTAGPMIIQTAQLTVVIQNLDSARAQVDKIVDRHRGYVGDLTVSAPGNGARTLTATLRLPAAQLEAAMAELKNLGRVESETQNGQDVTAQYVDLEARLSNSQQTEKRLLELLGNRTGKLSDVLEVENELSRVREQIERMEGERRLMAKQVEYATLTATVTEEYKAPARALPDSFGTRFRNAAIEGYQNVVSFLTAVALFLISDGPILMIWILILLLPARWAWRKYAKYRDTPSLG
jgi:anti-sigma factor RsiW